MRCIVHQFAPSYTIEMPQVASVPNASVCSNFLPAPEPRVNRSGGVCQSLAVLQSVVAADTLSQCGHSGPNGEFRNESVCPYGTDSKRYSRLPFGPAPALSQAEAKRQCLSNAS